MQPHIVRCCLSWKNASSSQFKSGGRCILLRCFPTTWHCMSWEICLSQLSPIHVLQSIPMQARLSYHGHMVVKATLVHKHVVFTFVPLCALQQFHAPLQQNSHIAKPPSCYYVNCFKAAGWCHIKLGTTCGCSAVPFLLQRFINLL